MQRTTEVHTASLRHPPGRIKGTRAPHLWFALAEHHLVGDTPHRSPAGAHLPAGRRPRREAGSPSQRTRREQGPSRPMRRRAITAAPRRGARATPNRLGRAAPPSRGCLRRRAPPRHGARGAGVLPIGCLRSPEPGPSGEGGSGAARRCRGDGASGGEGGRGRARGERSSAAGGRGGQRAAAWQVGACVGDPGGPNSLSLGACPPSEGRSLAPVRGQEGGSEAGARGAGRPRGWGKQRRPRSQGLRAAFPRGAPAWLGADPGVLGARSPAVRLAPTRSAFPWGRRGR